MAFSGGSGTQQDALHALAKIVAKYANDPEVVRAARAITGDCESRDDRCEVEAIYNAVKHGTDKVPGLTTGLRYVSDPRGTPDYYASAKATLRECRAGACAGDCDEHAVLVATLCAALGYKVGVRAWGKRKDEYVHVYPVVALPKKGPWPASYAGDGMDTTVPEASVGWQPPKGAVMTYWIEED